MEFAGGQTYAFTAKKKVINEFGANEPTTSHNKIDLCRKL